MTKLRQPVSVELAITKVAGLIGWERAAAVVQQSERTVRNWSDPDTPAEISLKAALKLDAAFIAAGGGSAPMRDTYQLLLEDAAGDRVADARRLVERTATVAKEAGEAVSLLVRASLPDATPRDREAAAREAEEAIDAFKQTLPELRVPLESTTFEGTLRGPGVPPLDRTGVEGNA